MKNVLVGAKAGARAGVCQAKVIRADGSVEYHYSISKVPWWRRGQRKWLKINLANQIAAETSVNLVPDMIPGDSLHLTVLPEEE